MLKLYVRSDYRNRDVQYAAGSVIEVSAEQAAWLLRDAPEAFGVVAEEPKTVEFPVADKMQRRSKKK